ncbi:5'-3' exoribonuclease 1 isoform X1 [Vespa velutina]|uniref:5'-3' exoribonuclease 1 isoform X1 n=1 Tax=Vespa velutina TaxID=202808 RepID=UPI001FB2C492|nr:5'-3' exoribonuclease 1 isoform X1 [Vespa velutina]
MGIPKFFRYISERYPCLSEMLKDYQIPEFDNLYLDMNGIIHACSHPNDSDINFHITNDEIFNNIFHYIEILFGMIQPQKLFFIAIDGVAPRAKINQQRARRFRAAKGTEMQKAKAKASGIDLKEELFDSNCITPGTVFMSEISKRLKYFITYKVSTDKLWQKCKVLFSGPEVVGEGEHKIMDYIRYLKSQIDYDPNIRHCLYGLDADLIMLGLCTHERNFSLLREEVKFGKKQKKVLTPEETKFCLLHLSLLREYLNHEFSPIEDKLSFPFNIEHIIDDWVLMGFLVGNDFIPNLPNLNITNGALPILYHVYMEVLPTLEGYINESGRLRLDRFEIFMERLSRIDIENFAEYYCDLKYLEAKMNKNKNTENDEQISQKDEDSSKNCSPSIKVGNLIRSSINMEMQDAEEEKIKYSHDDGLDYESDSDTYNMEFILHKRDYYMNKLEYEDVNEDVLRSQAEGYVRAIQWNLHYYYNGCCSWSWYYPHHYAPYISDIKGFKDLKFDFELGEPFKPFQQLLAVLPSYSKQLLPEALQSLLTEEESPIIDYYPSDFKTDLNGKKQDWEAIVLIPFIDEKILTEAMEPYYVKLTVEEHERNKHGPMYMYSYDKEILGLCHLPGNLPVIENHAQIKIINREDIYVPKEKLVKGLHPRVKCDIHYPGFPTLKYIKHTANLKKAKVKVFEQPSRGDNMILYIQQQEEPNLRQLAASLLHKTIFVEWPYLREAHIVGVSNHKWRINLINPQKEYSSDNIVEEELKGACAVQWTSEIKSIVETYKNRFGIDVGKTNILIHAQPLIGSKYIFAAQGKLSVEKQWQEMPTFYAYQTIVKDISTYCVNPLLYKTIDEIFVPGSNCFMLGHPHYGAMGEVIGPKINMNSGRIKIYVKVVTEPDLAVVKQAYTESKIQYIYGSTAAQRLGISSHLLSRITGTIYIMQNNTNEIINVGLNLKFNKKNEEIPGYTKKENGQWLYSIKAVDLIRDYMAKCPGLFERLAQNITNDVFNEDELFDKSSNELNSIIAWLKEQHFRGVESRPCGANILEADIVQKIEQEVDKYYEMYNDSNKAVVIQVKPQLLFKPELYSRQLPPDPKSYTRLLDRIVCIRGSFTVPIGYKGTIIGIQKTKAIIDSIYDVLFDKSFLGGLTFNGCSEHRGYKLSITDFINISHGERVERGKSGIENTSIETTDSWRRYQNAKNQVHSNVKPITQHKPSYELQHASKQLSSEFQQLWNELHKIEDSSGSSKTSNTSIVESNEINKQKSKQISQDPSAFLKEVLKISDDNTLINLPTKSSGTSANKNQSQIHKSSDAPPLVQKLFDYARQKRNEVKDDKNSIWYCSHLLNHYQILGMGLPRYDYFLNEQTNLIQAQILLPDAKVYLGDPCLTHAQAAESAARKVYEELNLEKVQKPDMKLLLKPPSQQWVNMRQNSSWSQNIRPPMVLPYISKPYQTSDNPVAHCSKWNMKMQQNPGFAHMAPHNSQIKVQTRQKTNESKSEIKNSTSFVPLQAQKKSRNVNTRQTNKETIQNHANSSQSGKQLAKQQETKETTFPKPPKPSNVNKTVEKEVRVQNNLQSSPKLQKSERPKRSRVAAKFVSPPATNGSEQ